MEENQKIEEQTILTHQKATEIVKIYPEMFTFSVRRDYTPNPFETYGKGMGVGLGWYPLIKDLVEQIKENDDRMNLENNTNHVTKVTQLKEKWGGLRFYVTGTTQENWKLIEKAEAASYEICEECGSKEDVGLWNAGWRLTKCKSCAVEHFNHLQQKGVWTEGTVLKDIFVTWEEYRKTNHDEEE